MEIKTKEVKQKTTFKEFLKIWKFNKMVEVKYVEEKFWELEILHINGTTTTLATIIPDSDEFQGQHSFDALLEWFMCSNNPYFKHYYKTGLRIWARDKIMTIDMRGVIKKRILKDGEGEQERKINEKETT